MNIDWPSITLMVIVVNIASCTAVEKTEEYKYKTTVELQKLKCENYDKSNPN